VGSDCGDLASLSELFFFFFFFFIAHFRLICAFQKFDLVPMRRLILLSGFVDSGFFLHDLFD
jgi:hypothetical protein